LVPQGGGGVVVAVFHHFPGQRGVGRGQAAGSGAVPGVQRLEDVQLDHAGFGLRVAAAERPGLPGGDVVHGRGDRAGPGVDVLVRRGAERVGLGGSRGRWRRLGAAAGRGGAGGRGGGGGPGRGRGGDGRPRGRAGRGGAAGLGGGQQGQPDRAGQATANDRRGFQGFSGS